MAALKRVGVFAVCRALTRGRLRIVCYHGIWRGGGGFAGDSMFMGADTFRARMQWLRSSGYDVVPLQKAADLRPSRRARVVITIDDGWYSTFADMLPILASLELPATLYCDTRTLMSEAPVAHVMAHYLSKVRPLGSAEARDAFARAVDLSASDSARRAAVEALAQLLGFDLPAWIDNRAFSYMTAAELRELAKALSVELHTHRHTLHDFSESQVVEEISANRACLGEILDRPPDSFAHFCYPSGATKAGADRILGSLGIVTATTLAAGLADPNGNRLMWPRILDGEHLSLLEFEAELAGVGDLLRALAAPLRRLMRSSSQESSEGEISK